ncbi:DEAD/DEAH box helicase [Ornithinicoccus hortensis]|uniref:SNF2 family DNA or RNA helicase n=1 Tax=Ornithinicoccus hortensis TaxID=82346 RepID=A0A542YMJ8_9MICO|nr:DEAD/DEAH box helicase [Ornithinicoccus hortensis]TQL49184.1 SNF2 family DNA or RNA helicase [Ornithinicoccus hortensis]
MGFQLRGAEWVGEVDQEQLVAAFDPATLQRGTDYARQSLVRGVTVADRGRVLVGEVAGSRPAPYTSIVTRLDRPRGVPWSSHCSCPVAISCKHVVALLVTVREQLRAGADAPARRPDWRHALRGVLDEPAQPLAPAPEPFEVGLVVEEVPDPASVWSAGSGTRLRLRPSRHSRTGWNRRTAWGDVTGSPGGQRRLEGRPEHREVCEEILRLRRRSAGGFGGPTDAAIHLDELGPALWPVLRRAVQVGMPLFTEPGVLGSVLLEEQVGAVQVDLGQDSGGGVRVRARTSPDPDGWRAARQALIGRPPHGLARWDEDGVLHLTAFDAPADPVAGQLLAGGEVTVPAEEVPTFFRDYLPRLRRRTQVVSTEGSVALPDTTPPLLLVRVERAGPRSVRVRFGFRYVTGDTAVDIPVGASSEAVLRDLGAESALVAALPVIDQIPGSRALVPARSHVLLAESAVLTGRAALDFLDGTVEALREDPRVVVEVAPDVPDFTEATEPPVVEIEVDDGPDNDWFDLRVSVRVEDEEVPFQELFQALVGEQDEMILDSGTWFDLDVPELTELRDWIEEARELVDPEATGLRLSRYHLSLWEELQSLGLVMDQSVRWQQAVAALDDLEALEAPPVPDSVRATLRPYQHDGYAWLSTLWRCRLGGILADDMGLGKTLQALAMIERARADGDLDAPVLVVAPTSVLSAWVGQAAQFVPDLPVVAIGQTSRKRGTPLVDAIDGAVVVVTSYAVARLDAEAFRSVRWSALVLDEAQTVKNFRSKTHRALLRLDRGLTLAITGTPIENNLMDLWSLLALTAPGLYPDPARFTQYYRRPIESGERPDLLDRLRTRIRPLMLRRTKGEVALDLPPKQVQSLDVVLAPRHRRIYQTHLQRERQRVLGLLDDPDGNRVAVLAALTRLRQLALHAGLVDEEFLAVESAKIETLVEHLTELAQEGHRALVFSQFTRFLGMVRERLTAEGIQTCYLDGSTRDRVRVVKEFRTGSAPAFLISLKAGGVGLTLTEADYVFVLDPWWNPAVENQAIDRAHRIGQDKPVFVYRMVSVDTIEERVQALQERKRDLFTRVLEDGELAGGISPEDIRGLLADD